MELESTLHDTVVESVSTCQTVLSCVRETKGPLHALLALKMATHILLGECRVHLTAERYVELLKLLDEAESAARVADMKTGKIEA